MLLEELDAVALRLTSEASVTVATRIDYEATHVLVVVERTKAEVSRSLLLKWNERSNHVHDISRFDYAPNGKVIYLLISRFYNC